MGDDRRREAEASHGYEPPRIELRLTAEALEREILYAGTGSAPQ
jgi:hypothetical protein